MESRGAWLLGTGSDSGRALDATPCPLPSLAARASPQLRLGQVASAWCGKGLKGTQNPSDLIFNHQGPQKTCELALGCFSFSLLAAKPLDALSCLENRPWPEAQGTQGTTTAMETEQYAHSSSAFLLPVPTGHVPTLLQPAVGKGGGGSTEQWGQRGGSGLGPHPPNPHAKAM